ncbi:MAG: hypothetical protein KAT32_02125 [Candidatus Moranbacteria bacterium]|nr:hypothetical protein [Candidatus Moranbacteria bacterium]
MKKENKKTYNIDEVGSMIEALTSTVQLAFDQNDITNRHLNNIEKDVSILKTDMVEVKDRLGNVEEKVDVLQEDVTEIKHKLSEKVDRDEFNALEKRMIKLERLVFSRG